MEKLSKPYSYKEGEDHIALNNPNNKSSKGILRQPKWAIYSYDGLAISIHVDPLANSDYLNPSDIESEEDDQKYLPNSNIYDIIEANKANSIDDIKNIIQNKLLWTNQDSSHNNTNMTECFTNSLNKIDNSKPAFNDPYGIIERRKHSKLTSDQIIFLKSQLSENQNSISNISRKYGISLSTWSRIKNMDEKRLEKLPRRRLVKLNQKERVSVTNSIETYYCNQEYPFTINDVREHLKNTEDVDYPYQLIRGIVRNNLNLTYKRTLSRPISAEMNRVRLLRKLFSIQTIQEIHPKFLIANWDEWSINRNTKLNYSWSKIGANKETKNSVFVGSISIIMCIYSNGCWFAMMTTSTTTSQVFIHFMSKMNEWLCKNNNFNYERLHLYLDNCPYHKSKIIVDYLSKLKMNIFFLPPYSPSLAPIELAFGFLKRKLKKSSRGIRFNLQSKEAFHSIFDTLKDMNRRLVLSFFNKFYKELKVNLKIL